MEENNQAFYLRAVEIATNAHMGQTDKGGNPYIEHPLAVASAVPTTELKIVAVLHDVLEDSDITAEDLRREGFPEEIIEAVCVLAHKRGSRDSYMHYIEKVKKIELARRVKIADIGHNLDLSRIPNPTPADYRRCEKYKKALKFLEET